MTDQLANVLLSGDTDTPVRLRQAVVSSTSPVEVTLGGQSGIPAATFTHSAYTPSVNNVVLCLQLGTDLIILDQVTTGG